MIKKIINGIVDFVTLLIVFLFILSACSLDSTSYIPLKVCIACLVWIIPVLSYKAYKYNKNEF